MISAKDAYNLTCQMPDDIIELILKAIVNEMFEIEIGYRVLTYDECAILKSFGYKLIPHPVSSEVCCISWEHICDEIN